MRARQVAGGAGGEDCFEMKRLTYRGRRAVQVERDGLALTVTEEGGHVAEFLDQASGVNPLWVPGWRSIEPSQYSHAAHPEFGQSTDSQLLAGLLGHNVCLDLFGGPGLEEAAAGIPVHGEASVAAYAVDGGKTFLEMQTSLPRAELKFERRIELAGAGVARFRETVRNLACTDRPVGWTQHVTLGAPFLEKGETRILLSADLSKVYEKDFNDGLGMQMPGAVFDWPMCPRKDGGFEDLSTFSAEAASGGLTAHRMNPDEDYAYFVAWSPRLRMAFGYIWRREEFPWLARWEENHLRPGAPWNGEGLALGMEFGVSPMVETRREMVERGRMFDTPCFQWVPALGSVAMGYCAFLRAAKTEPKGVRWDGGGEVELSL